MKEVTELVQLYRECARSLWNRCLRPGADFNSVDAFGQICGALFEEVVLKPLDKRGYRKTQPSEAFPFIHVVPIADTIPIMINRPTNDGNKYWDEKIAVIPRRGSTLLLVDHFDWDQLGFIDFQYYRVRIGAFLAHPDLVGREALVEVQHCTVLAEEPPS
jgi:hypothetical protein